MSVESATSADVHYFKVVAQKRFQRCHCMCVFNTVVAIVVALESGCIVDDYKRHMVVRMVVTMLVPMVVTTVDNLYLIHILRTRLIKMCRSRIYPYH